MTVTTRTCSLFEKRPLDQQAPGGARSRGAVFGEHGARQRDSPRDKDRTRCMVDNLGGHRPEERGGEWAAAVAANDDEICADLGGFLHDHARRSPQNGLCLHGAVRATERAHRLLDLRIDEPPFALMQGGVPTGRQRESGASGASGYARNAAWSGPTR